MNTNIGTQMNANNTPVDVGEVGNEHKGSGLIAKFLKWLLLAVMITFWLYALFTVSEATQVGMLGFLAVAWLESRIIKSEKNMEKRIAEMRRYYDFRIGKLAKELSDEQIIRWCREWDEAQKK